MRCFMQSYKHFTEEERKCLSQKKREGWSLRKIATFLGKNVSSISREVRKLGKHYNYKQAHCLYLFRRKQSKRKPRIKENSDLEKFIMQKLNIFWSPELISVRWNEDNPTDRVGFTTIYRLLAQNQLTGYSPKTHLRRRGKRYYGKRSKFNAVQPTHTIHDMPSVALSRTRCGDWEADTVCGAPGQDRIITLVDRKSRYLKMCLVSGHTSTAVVQALIDMLRPFPTESILLDNGSEFAAYKQINESLDTTCYFADPHSPWQRGSNENINGLIRFYFPKGTVFREVSRERLQEVEDQINHRPRKCLDYKTPYQVFYHCCT